MPDPLSSSDPAERLLEDFWEAREQRASRRELVSEFAAAALFVAAAGGLLALPPVDRPHRHDHQQLQARRDAATGGLAQHRRRQVAPIGMLAAVATDHGLGAVLLVLPLGGLLLLLARDRSARIAQAHRRLELVKHERSRLQAAVRRMGDAFAAKLDLDALLTITLRGSLEALDADAGRLTLSAAGTTRELESGDAARRGAALRAAAEAAAAAHSAQQLDHHDGWVLALPLRAADAASDLRGVLCLARHARAFQADEIALGFKAHNDTFGHLAGDALLTRLAGKLTEAVGARGGAYRLGGDEFCALLPVDVDELDDVIGGAADALTERGDEFTIGASCGVVVLPREADNLERALQLADERMYARKHSRGSGARHQARDVLMRTMQAKQPALDEHSDEVAQLAVRVARRLGLAGEQLDEIARAGELHDIGKVGIPDAILNKPGPLSPDEWEFMRQHTILGERILNAAPAPRPVARLVRSTHERWDGHGYPDRLAGARIPLGARIVAVCDAYEAMTADRV